MQFQGRKMKIVPSLLLLIAITFLSGCLATTSPTKQQTRIDEVPMYGGMDRSQIPEIKAADEKFISDVSAQFGSRERASMLWVNQGYRFYREDQLGMAMRRFNQAWLLNPENPEVYAGFGSVLNDQAKHCDAMSMMNKALSMNPPTFQGIYTDAGLITVLCALRDSSLPPERKTEILALSETRYKKAESVEPDKNYLYNSWARAYYWRGQYQDAWNTIAKQRASGGKPNEQLMKLLMSKMPEPKS